MPSADYWQRRCKRAEEALAKANECIKRDAATLAHAGNALHAVQNRAVLLSITRDNRRIVFKFIRNGQLTECVTYGTWDQPVEEWQKELIL